jgi:hypothetical protein
MSVDLHERLENIRITALKKAHEDYAKACEDGMNTMVQLARQAALPTPEVP